MFKFNQIIYSFVILIIFQLNPIDCLEYYSEKPDFIETCKIYEPEFTKCSTRSIQKLLTHLTTLGLPELNDTFGSLDPIKLDKVIFKGDNNQAVTIKANLTDLFAKGLSGMVIKENKVSKKDFNWDTKVFIPNLRLDGQYQMAGRILLIPLNGHGKLFIDIDDLDLTMHSKVRLYEKGGFTFYNVKSLRIVLHPKKVRTQLDNIFNGSSKEVERSTNQFFNENWRDFFEALRPLITETVEQIMLKILKKTFDLLPGNFFVSDIPTSEQLYNKKKN